MRVRREREYKKEGGKIKEEKRGERIKRCKEVELVSDVSRLRHILKIFASLLDSLLFGWSALLTVGMHPFSPLE